jgi:hypothetical protein
MLEIILFGFLFSKGTLLGKTKSISRGHEKIKMIINFNKIII